jgi:hypothetical protein
MSDEKSLLNKAGTMLDAASETSAELPAFNAMNLIMAKFAVDAGAAGLTPAAIVAEIKKQAALVTGCLTGWPQTLDTELMKHIPDPAMHKLTAFFDDYTKKVYIERNGRKTAKLRGLFKQHPKTKDNEQ